MNNTTESENKNQEIIKLLTSIQQNLKAPKNQLNKFGNYKYRNCEDILEAVKPLLGKAVIRLQDDIKQIGDRYYVKATAILQDETGAITAHAYAREAEVKKGMDDSQITGASSSYARKYALNALFAIDDTKDADSQDNTKKEAHVYQKDEQVPETIHYCSRHFSQLKEKKEITEAEAGYSKKQYGYELCRECQEEAKKANK